MEVLHALEDIIHREGPDASGDHQWLFNAKVIFLDTFPHLADVWDALTPLASKRCFMLIKTHVLTYLMHSQIGHIPLDEKDHRQPAPGANNSIAVYVCLSFCLSVFLYVCLSVYLYISLSAHLSMWLSPITCTHHLDVGCRATQTAPRHNGASQRSSSTSTKTTSVL